MEAKLNETGTKFEEAPEGWEIENQIYNMIVKQTGWKKQSSHRSAPLDIAIALREDGCIVSIKSRNHYRWYKKIKTNTLEEAAALAEKIEASMPDYFDSPDKIKKELTPKQYLEKLQKTQQEKGYKQGWVWYRLKEKYGYDKANELCPR